VLSKHWNCYLVKSDILNMVSYVTLHNLVTWINLLELS
jgi:hypothetical protein